MYTQTHIQQHTHIYIHANRLSVCCGVVGMMFTVCCGVVGMMFTMCCGVVGMMFTMCCGVVGMMFTIKTTVKYMYIRT